MQWQLSAFQWNEHFLRPTRAFRLYPGNKLAEVSVFKEPKTFWVSWKEILGINFLVLFFESFVWLIVCSSFLPVCTVKQLQARNVWANLLLDVEHYGQQWRPNSYLIHSWQCTQWLQRRKCDINTTLCLSCVFTSFASIHCSDQITYTAQADDYRSWSMKKPCSAAFYEKENVKIFQQETIHHFYYLQSSLIGNYWWFKFPFVTLTWSELCNGCFSLLVRETLEKSLVVPWKDWLILSLRGNTIQRTRVIVSGSSLCSFRNNHPSRDRNK